MFETSTKKKFVNFLSTSRLLCVFFLRFLACASWCAMIFSLEKKNHASQSQVLLHVTSVKSKTVNCLIVISIEMWRIFSSSTISCRDKIYLSKKTRKFNLNSDLYHMFCGMIKFITFHWRRNAVKWLNIQ